MKLFWVIGKVLTLLFWAMVAVNPFIQLASPFDVLIKLAGCLVAMTHVLELFLFNGSLRGRRHPWLDRLLILIFGIFHLQSFSASRRSSEIPHA